MPIPDSVIYLKKTLRSLWNKPRLNTLISSVRYYADWRDHLKPGRNSVIDRSPWISFSAIQFLKKLIRKDMRVFEYGSGGSTLFWITRVKEVVSIEHDTSWYFNMKKQLDEQSVQNFKYILAEPVNDPQFGKKRFEDPEDYISADPAYKGKNFEQYAKSIDTYPDNYFDIIVVDGRARPSCIKHGIPKLKRNGWLVIDNSERTYYLAPFSFEKNSWKTSKFAGPVPYTRDFSETSLLKKII
ncbi:MAG TPA: hypothetical protein VFI33_16960 [Puia sp.]|nr:hypothetical protein [Puia sp.]